MTVWRLLAEFLAGAGIFALAYLLLLWGYGMGMV